MIKDVISEGVDFLKSNINDPFKEIPGDLKWPFIGSSLEFASDINKVILDNLAKYGPIFKLRVMGYNLIALAGTEANKLVLQEEQDNFLSKKGWGFIIGDLFKEAIMLTDGAEHTRFRRIMQTAFHKVPMTGYLDVIETATNQFLDHEMTIRNGKLRVYPEMVRLTMKIAGKLFFGFEFSNKDLSAIVDVTKASMWPIHLEIPFTPYERGMEARRYLTKRYKERIKQNRLNPGDDMFSQMCIAKSETGEMFSDQEIINQMIFLMLASHDTTTSTLTSLMFETAKNPYWQDIMRAESNNFYNDGDLEYGRLKDFKEIGKVLNETLRLHPALVVMPRFVERDFSFGGHKIPKGSRVAISTYATHIMPEIYPNPFLFDPNRFSEERAEHKKVPFSFIPFGAGRHICIGQYFAEMEIKIIISQFVKRFKWSIPKGYEIKYRPPLNAPSDGFPVRIERIYN